jgi:aspartate kinase
VYKSVDSSLPIVQKYGGTSVGSKERILEVAKRTKYWFDQGYRKLAVVVSAQSGETNRLISLIKDINPNPPSDAYDVAIAAGEQVSVGLTAAALAGVGVQSVPLLAHQLGILTDDFHSRARIISIQTDSILRAWESGQIPVIAGFQGVTNRGDVTTLGRGGSDTSAVALAVALKASFCEINTDVDGLFSADPRVVPKANHIALADFEVALEMASLGSKVLHPRCVELGKKWQMPITVRNSFKGEDSPMTIIKSLKQNELMESAVVTGVSVEKDVLRVQLEGIPDTNEVFSDVFREIAENGVNVDIIVFDKDHSKNLLKFGFTASESDRLQVESAIKGLSKKMGQSLQSAIQSSLAKVSIVGVGMRSHSGVAQKAFDAMSKASIGVLMVSTSEIKISFVVDKAAADRAALALHQVFIEGSRV